MPHDVTDHTRTEHDKKTGWASFFCSWPCDVTSALFRQISDSAITLICCDGFVVHILILYRNRFVVLSMKQLDAFFICTDLWCLLLSEIPVRAHPINGYYPVISNTPLLTYMGRIRETRHGK